MRIHLDTDLGSDTDDLCALATLLGWPDVQLVGVTTNTDPRGQRAGYVEHALGLAGRDDLQVVAGAEATLAPTMVPVDFPDYWPRPIGGATGSVRCGDRHAGRERRGRGHRCCDRAVYEPLPARSAAARAPSSCRGRRDGRPRSAVEAGIPTCGVDDDFNVQQDRMAAAIVLERCDVVPIGVTIEVSLRAGHLPRLRAAGPLGRLVADQAVARARDHRTRALGASFERLPDDLLNFQHDPLACAVALGWNGVEIEEIPTALELRDDRLWMTERDGAPTLRTVTAVDAPRFEETWLQAVERASTPVAT
jgi:purine nucleosidase